VGKGSSGLKRLTQQEQQSRTVPAVKKALRITRLQLALTLSARFDRPMTAPSQPVDSLLGLTQTSEVLTRHQDCNQHAGLNLRGFDQHAAIWSDITRKVRSRHSVITARLDRFH
jgi:hypothetical protein